MHPQMTEQGRSGGMDNTANVHILPLTSIDRNRAVNRMAASPQGPVYMPELAKRFGLPLNASRRTIINHVRILHQHHGFPAPTNLRFEKARLISGARAIIWHSHFARDLVELWFAGGTHPATAALAEQANRDRTRRALADNARRLAGARA